MDYTLPLFSVFRISIFQMSNLLIRSATPLVQVRRRPPDRTSWGGPPPDPHPDESGARDGAANRVTNRGSGGCVGVFGGGVGGMQEPEIQTYPSKGRFCKSMEETC